MIHHRVLICLVPILMLPWPNMTLLSISSILSLCEHGTASLSSFLDYLNTVAKTGKIKFTMEIAGDTDLEFLDLKLKISEGKIRVDVYAKSTNSFSYTTPNTCYPKHNICIIYNI